MECNLAFSIGRRTRLSVKQWTPRILNHRAALCCQAQLSFVPDSMVKAHRRRGIFQCAKCVLMVWLIVFDLTALTRAEQRRQLLAQVDSTLSRLDFLDGGSCGAETCRREAVSASAQVAGVPVPGNWSCLAVGRAATDNVGTDDAEKATIEVVHVCQDAQGTTTTQVGSFAGSTWSMCTDLLPTGDLPARRRNRWPCSNYFPGACQVVLSGRMTMDFVGI